MAPTPVAESRPSIIVNQGLARRAERTEPAETPAAAETRQPTRDSGRSPIYLVALNESSIWAVRAYWTEGPVLHFLTLKNERKQVPLSQVDRALSEQLNSERGVEFHLK
jgi:hypothetical protein